MTAFLPIFNDAADGALLRPGSAPFTVDFTADLRSDRKYRLFFAGESAIFKFWKNEPDFQWQYHTVTDSLDTGHACKSQYCLDFSSAEPVSYIRRVYRDVSWPPSLSYLWSPPTDDLSLGIRMRSDGLVVREGGFLRMFLEARLHREGVADGSVAFPPDFVFTIDLSEDTAGEWKDFSLPCKIPSGEIAHLSVMVEGAGYSGEVYFERPELKTALGWNLLPDFSVPVPDKQKFDWTAQYLSRKEWPCFCVELDGLRIFEGEVFERCHLNSEWELPLQCAISNSAGSPSANGRAVCPHTAALPESTADGRAVCPHTAVVPGQAPEAQNVPRESAAAAPAEHPTHRLSIRLLSKYHDPLPYTIHEIGLISQPRAAVTLVAAASIAPAGGFARLLFETETDGVEIEIVPHDGHLSGGRFAFAKAGLHGVRLVCGEPGGPAGFTVRGGEVEFDGEIGRIVRREDDGVVTGTGDMVYVHQDADSFREYLKWYLENEVGDLVTARPTYRWSGSRTLDAAAWKDFARVLNELGMEYVHMWDGRELPGQNANPDAGLLSGPGFRGSQTHERDGACFYWGVRPSGHSKFLRQLWEMQQRVRDEDPLHVNPQYLHENYFLVDGEMYWHRHPVTPRDMRLAHDMQVAHIAEIRGGATRHTGPTVMFKYFFEAGYSWIGYESMYGAMEPYMAFLRGAARFGGVARPGVHHAMQWSSSPYDVPEHVRRYRLALFSSYIQGACEINTEEGLWHIEEYYSGYNRFGKVCREHLRQQQDFYKYTRTHSRRGKFRTPLALLHGRYDGWHGFGNHQPWGMFGLPLTDAEKSWDLLKVFYPLANPGKPSYCHYCPTDREIGFYSGTPLGCIDAVPVESSAEQLGEYRALAFMGYNCAEKDDFDKLLESVKNGRRLLLTRAHMTQTTSYDEIAAGRLSQIDHPLAFANGAPNMRQTTFNGMPLAICENALPPDEVVAVADDGLPLVCRYKCGGGEVTLINTSAWPSDPAIRGLYEAELRRLMKEETSKEPVWCECGDDVEFAVYSCDDGSSEVYFLAVDWYRDPASPRHAVLRAGNTRHELSFPFGPLVKAVVRDATVVFDA